MAISNLMRFFVCLIFLSLWACKSQNETHKSEAPLLPPDEVLLSTASPKRAYIKEAVVELSQRLLMEPVTGKIVYDEAHTVRISSPISGRVIGKIAALGDKVKSKDPLLELDSPDLGQAQADYADASADLNLAERAFQRTQELYGQGVVPRKDFEQAQDGLERARSEAARARLKLVNLGIHNVNRTDNRFNLLAPISGVIVERNVNPGMEVRPDLAAPLYVISDLSHLWVLMDIFEKDIASIHVGQTVWGTVPAYPNEKFSATIDYISQVLDETTRTVKVRCLIPNLQGKLLPAMYASVEVQSDADDKAIIVPLNALFTEGESDWLFVAIGDGLYKKRPVKVGLRLKDKAVILEGLNPGERLVVGGALLLRTEEDAEPEKGEANP